MANSLGTLSIDVLANIASMVSDLGKAQAESARTAKNIERQFEQMQSSVMGSFRNMVAGLGAAFSGQQVFQLGKATLDTADNFAKLSQKVGVSVEDLSALNHAANLSGVEINSLQTGMVKFSKAIVETAAGSQEQIAAFKALGISQQFVKDNMGNTKVLFDEVAQKMSGFKDGANKAALAVALFGKSGADMIPMLNAGKEGLAEAAKEAQLFGLTMKGDMAKSAEEFNDNMTRVHGVVQGFANQVMERILPQLLEASRRFIEWAKNSDGLKTAINAVGDAAVFLINHASEIVTVLKIIAGLAAARFFLGMAEDAQVFAKGVMQGTESVSMLQKSFIVLQAAIVGWQIGSYLRENFLEAQLAGIALVEGLLTGWERIKQGAAIMWEGIKASFTGAINFVRDGIAGLFDDMASKASVLPDFMGGAKAAAGFKELANAVRPATSALDDLQVKVIGINKETDANIAAIKKTTGEMADYAIENSKAAKSVKEQADKSSEAAKANLNYSGALEKTTGASKEAKKAAEELAKAQASAAQFLTKLRGELDPVSKAYQDHVANLVEASKHYDELIAKGASLAEAQQIIAEATKLSTAALDKNIDALKQQADVVGTMLKELEKDQALVGLEGKELAIAQAVNKAKDAYAQLNDEVKKLHPLTQEELDLLAQKTAAHYDEIQAVENAKQVQEEYQSTVQNGLTGAASALTDFTMSGFKKYSDFGKALIGTTKQFIADIIQQFFRLKLVNPIMNSMFGLALPTGAMAGNGGAAGGAGGGLGGLFGGGGSGGGLMAAIAGLTAGIGAFKNAGGGGGGLAAGAAYGVGTYFAGSALTAGAGALGAGAGLAGAGSAALGAIPVAGWIALGAMALDKFTGGGLFGTKWKETGASNTTFDLSGGVSTQVEESKKKAFFGGTKTRYVPGQVPADIQQAFNDELSKIREIGEQAAAALGATNVEIITGSHKQVLDKKGNIKDQFSTILGKIYKEGNEDFLKRARAETIVAQVQQVAPDAQQIAQQWRSSATDLLAGAQFLLAAQVDINQGNTTLGGSLKDVTAIVQQYAIANESLVDTYARLSLSTASLQQAVDLMGINLGKSKEEFIGFAADIAAAAGGIDKAQALWSGFFQNFYSSIEQSEQQIAALKQQSGASLSAIGLTPDVTMQEFRTLFEQALPTLGADAVARWLEAGNTLATLVNVQSEYNAALEESKRATEEAALAAAKAAEAMRQAAQEYADFMTGIKVASGAMTPFQKALYDLYRAEQDNIKKLNELARAAGKAGAAEEDLAQVHAATAASIAKLVAEATASGKGLVKSLYGDTEASMQQVVSASAAASDAVQSVAESMKGFADSLLIGDLSPLNDQEKLKEGMKQLMAASAAGDAQAVQQLSQEVLQTGKRLYATGSDYRALFDQVHGIVENTKVMAPATGGGGFSGGFDASSVAKIEDDPLQRAIQANELAKIIGDLAAAQDKSVKDIASTLGVPMDKFAKDLGLNMEELFAFLEKLKKEAEVNIFPDKATPLGAENATAGIPENIDKTSPAAPQEPGSVAGSTEPVTANIETKPTGPTEFEKGLSTQVDKVLEALNAILKAVDDGSMDVTEATKSVASEVGALRGEVRSNSFNQPYERSIRGVQL